MEKEYIFKFDVYITLFYWVIKESQNLFIKEFSENQDFWLSYMLADRISLEFIKSQSSVWRIYIIFYEIKRIKKVTGNNSFVYNEAVVKSSQAGARNNT